MTIRPDHPRRRDVLLVLGGLACGAAALPVQAAPGAANGPYVKKVSSFLELRHRNVVLQRWDLSCGAASLSTLLAYQHQDPVPEREIAEAMLKAGDPDRIRTHLGFSLLDLKRYVQARGYLGEGYGQLGLPDLAELAPAITPIRVSAYDHFVVFRGFAKGRAVLADSAYGNRTMLAEGFRKVWRGQIGFVVKQSGGGGRATPKLDDKQLQLVDPAAIRVSGS